MTPDEDLDSIIGQVLFNEVLTPESLKRNTREGDSQLKLPLSTGKHRLEADGFILGISWVAANIQMVCTQLRLGKDKSPIQLEFADTLEEFAKGIVAHGEGYALELWPDFPPPSPESIKMGKNPLASRRDHD